MEFANLDLSKRYTYADYYGWTFAERVELIDGKVYQMFPAPLVFHQVIVGRIHLGLGNYLRGKSCSVFIAPFDVRLPNNSKEDGKIYNVFQPDLCVICDPGKLDKRGCIGAPDIIVEVLSPGNTAKEMKIKYDVYEQSGVKEYWIVFPENEAIISYILIDGKFMATRPFSIGCVLTSSVLPGFELDITELFENINQQY